MAKYDKEDILKSGISDIFSMNEVIKKKSPIMKSANYFSLKRAMEMGRIDWIILGGMRFILMTDKTKQYFKYKEDGKFKPDTIQEEIKKRIEEDKLDPHTEEQKKILRETDNDDLIREE